MGEQGDGGKIRWTFCGVELGKRMTMARTWPVGLDLHPCLSTTYGLAPSALWTDNHKDGVV